MFESALPRNAQSTLAVLGKTKVLPPKTYLAGGTSLALQLGHRISVDFDFFTPSEFNQEKLSRVLSKIGQFSTKNIAKNTLFGKFNEVDFSIFTYANPLLFKTTSYKKINLASPKDIGAMKIPAILTRGVRKDFIDLYFLSKMGISLDDCLHYFDRKYKQLDNQLYGIIRSFSYFEEARKSDMPPMIKKVAWTEIEKFFEKEAIRLAKKYLG